MKRKNVPCSSGPTGWRFNVCKYSFSDAIGDFNSCVMLSIKLDWRRFKLIVLMVSVKYIETPTITTSSRELPTKSIVQYSGAFPWVSPNAKTDNNTQPTNSTTSTTSKITPSVI